MDKNNSSQSVDPMKLLQGAASQAALGGQSMMIAQSVLNSPDLAQMMTEALSTPADILPAVRKQTILTVVVDDSGSIRNSRNEQTIRDGVNLYFDAQKGGRYAPGILAGIFYLNGTVLNPYNPLAEVTKLDDFNYLATGQTPLYDVACTTLLSVIAEAEKIESQTGANVRTHTLFVTDGQDYGSVTCDAKDVAQIVSDMLAEEGKHIVGGFGIGTHWNWETVFGDMGILPQWIIRSGDDAKSMRLAFDNASRSTKNAINQQPNGFSQQAIAGGFGAP